MNTNKGMRDAQRNKKDEFYTTREVIDAELLLYKSYFKNKRVYCPCDGPDSEFVKFFLDNFEELGLWSLTATCYNPDGRGIYLYTDHAPRRNDLPPVPVTIYGYHEVKDDIEWKDMEGDGDFRTDPMCQKFFKDSDVIATNPPFSLFREFIVKIMEEYSNNINSFFIVGNMNAILTKDVFKWVANGCIKWGPSIKSGDRPFRVPEDYDGDGIYEDLDHRKYINVKGVRWFTTTYPDGYCFKDAPRIELTKNYHKDDYPMFDNLPGIINVDRVEDIPKDYYGLMGVPLTFFDKYNPYQFRIIDGINRYLVLDRLDVNETAKANNWHLLTVNGKQKYFRIIVQRVYGKD